MNPNSPKLETVDVRDLKVGDVVRILSVHSAETGKTRTYDVEIVEAPHVTTHEDGETYAAAGAWTAATLDESNWLRRDIYPYSRDELVTVQGRTGRGQVARYAVAAV